MNDRDPDWMQEKRAELETQIGRPLTQVDIECLDIDQTGKTVTVARNPLLSEIRVKERGRRRGLDLPPNP